MATGNKKYFPFLALGLYWLLLNYLVLHAPIAFFEVDQLVPIQTAQIQANPTQDPALLTSSGWRPVTLPDDWYQSDYADKHHWYRAEVSLNPAQTDIWAVYLPSVTHNAAAFVNGQWIGQGGRFNAPVARNHNRPLLFSFSSQLLVPGSNQITLRVATSHAAQGLLDQFYVAPANELLPHYLWKHFVRVDLIQWFTLIMYVMGLILFVFWLARPQDKIYGLFALLLCIWATHNLNLFVIHIPMSAHAWEAMTMSTLGWTVVTMIFFNHRYVGQKNRRVEKVMVVFAMAGLGIFALPDVGSILRWGYGVWDTFLIIFGSYAIFHLLRVYWLERGSDVYLMLLVGIPILVFGFHDILTVNHLRDRRDGLTIQYSVIPAAALFSFFLVRRFVQSINQAEELAMTLEARVNDRERQLQHQFDQLKALESQQVLSQERERIMRDMHDGIGGQLVSVIAQLQTHGGEVFRTLEARVQHSLTDLRFVIDSLDPALHDLSTLLGMMRSRLQQQLDAVSIVLVWDVTELPNIGDLSPRKSLHIMRIVQEVVANAIKHSQASEMRLSTRVAKGDTPKIVILMEDNGVGFEPDCQDAEGRGMTNMRYRAGQIGATILFARHTGKTRVTLEIPIERQG